MQLFRIQAITIIIIIPFFLFMAHSACPCEAHKCPATMWACRLQTELQICITEQMHSTPIWSHVIVHLTTVFQLCPIVSTLRCAVFLRTLYFENSVRYLIPYANSRLCFSIAKIIATNLFRFCVQTSAQFHNCFRLLRRFASTQIGWHLTWFNWIWPIYALPQCVSVLFFGHAINLKLPYLHTIITINEN